MVIDEQIILHAGPQQHFFKSGFPEGINISFDKHSFMENKYHLSLQAGVYCVFVAYTLALKSTKESYTFSSVSFYNFASSNKQIFPYVFNLPWQEEEKNKKLAGQKRHAQEPGKVSFSFTFAVASLIEDQSLILTNEYLYFEMKSVGDPSLSYSQ